MTWTEALQFVRDRLQEDTEAFYTLDKLKRAGHEIQRNMSTQVPELCEAKRTFTTVSGQREYTLAASVGSDVLGFRRMDYSTTNSLVNIKEIDKPLVSMSGLPLAYYIRNGDTLGLEPSPSTSGDTITAFAFRMPPRYAMTVACDSGTHTSATAAISVAAGVRTLTITTNVGTSSFSLSNASYDTMSELKTAVEAAVTNSTVTLGSDVWNSEPSSQLEVIAAGSCLGTGLTMYFDPLIPRYAEDTLIAGIKWKMFEADGEETEANKHRAEYMELLSQAKAQALRIKQSYNHRKIKDVYRRGMMKNDRFYPLDGGYALIG